MNRIKFYLNSLIPALYFISMWLCLFAVAFLVFEDALRAAGIVSAISLFYILLGKRNLELQQLSNKYRMEELLKHAKSTEKKGQ